MTIKKVLSSYEVRFRVNGRGSREHKRVFPTKAECERFQRYTIAQCETQADVKPWLEQLKNTRLLSELLKLRKDTRWHFIMDAANILTSGSRA